MTTAAVEHDAFEGTLRDAEQAMEAFRGDAYGPRHKEGLDEVKGAIKECHRSLKAVEFAIPEIRSSEERGVWRRKVTAGKKAIRAIEKDMAHLDRLDAKKDRLFQEMKQHLDADAHDPNDPSEPPSEARIRAINTSKALAAQNKSLNRSEEVALATERLGMNTLSTLVSQRETMEKAADKTDEIRIEVSRSRAVITEIKKSFVYSRCMQFLIILGLLAAITLTVYFRWLK